jgi:hypothetical protein
MPTGTRLQKEVIYLAAEHQEHELELICMFPLLRNRRSEALQIIDIPASMLRDVPWDPPPTPDDWEYMGADRWQACYGDCAAVCLCVGFVLELTLSLVRSVKTCIHRSLGVHTCRRVCVYYAHMLTYNYTFL